VFDQRVLIPSMNLRDLGGYETVDGRQVAYGVLLRGGHMADLIAAETAMLADLGLATIVDLRRPDEIEVRPTPVLDGVTNVNYSVSDPDNSFAVAVNNITDPTAAANVGDAGVAYYRDLVATKLPLFRPVFDAIVGDGRRPVLFHCTAGKDRTGFVAATLLELLGVPSDVIMADYLLTNEVRAQALAGRLEVVRAERAIARGIEPEGVPDYEMDAIRRLMFVEEAFLAATYDEVQRRYGTWPAMAEQALGLDQATVERFRDQVLG
jgi:protein-tyrosine phosphatase